MGTPFHQRYVASGMAANEFLPLGVDAALTRAHERSNPVVVTGQQVGLFLGPLYTLAKAASALWWSKKLGAKPLFWLQTEDHDFAEIDHAWLPGLKVRLRGDDRRISVAHRVLGDDITRVLAQVKDAIADRPHAEETLTLLQRHYHPDASLAGAFAGLLGELMPELSFFDPRTPETARKMAPIIERAYREAPEIDRLLLERGKAIEAAGHVIQIPIRGGTPLPFMHDEAGERQRVKQPDWDLLARDPLRFSTSALLRPIVQDTLLPTALYIGGPAEVDYFAQAACLYPVFDLPPPIVALRGRIRVITPRIAAKLEKLGLQPSDLDDESTLTYKLATKLGVLHEAPNRTWLAELDKRIDRITTKSADRARRSIHNAMALFERRYLRELTVREQTVSAQLEQIRDWIRPNSAPQERVLCFVAFAAQVGPKALVQAIIAAIEPPLLKDIWL